MLSKSRWGMSGVPLYRLKNKRDMPMSCSWLSQLAECFAAQHVFAWFCNCGVRRDRNEECSALPPTTVMVESCNESFGAVAVMVVAK